MNGPEHYREAELLMSAASYTHGPGGDPVHPEAAAHHLAMAQVHATLALAAAQTAPATPQLETEPAVAYVYRAAWGMTPLGTYTNATAAQTHCEADAVNHDDEPESATYEWFGDAHELDDPCDLLVTRNGAQTATEYSVTRIEVAAEYDAEADA